MDLCRQGKIVISTLVDMLIIMAIFMVVGIYIDNYLRTFVGLWILNQLYFAVSGK